MICSSDSASVRVGRQGPITDITRTFLLKCVPSAGLGAGKPHFERKPLPRHDLSASISHLMVADSLSTWWSSSSESGFSGLFLKASRKRSFRALCTPAIPSSLKAFSKISTSSRARAALSLVGPVIATKLGLLWNPKVVIVSNLHTVRKPPLTASMRSSLVAEFSSRVGGGRGFVSDTVALPPMEPRNSSFFRFCAAALPPSAKAFATSSPSSSAAPFSLRHGRVSLMALRFLLKGEFPEASVGMAQTERWPRSPRSTSK
mmetsp:Transcript_102858/g.199336  ORF Transcript_102858/g.199336 Transcript_102858/m.199336 type:complete len:260 (+) Transcript_102858:906-1685(+)